MEQNVFHFVNAIFYIYVWINVQIVFSSSFYGVCVCVCQELFLFITNNL